jgi:hypothetical protein
MIRQPSSSLSSLSFWVVFSPRLSRRFSCRMPVVVIHFARAHAGASEVVKLVQHDVDSNFVASENTGEFSLPRAWRCMPDVPSCLKISCSGAAVAPHPLDVVCCPKRFVSDTCMIQEYTCTASVVASSAMPLPLVETRICTEFMYDSQWAKLCVFNQYTFSSHGSHTWVTDLPHAQEGTRVSRTDYRHASLLSIRILRMLSWCCRGAAAQVCEDFR